MSPFIADLLITLAFWAAIAGCTWLMVRGARRVLWYIRRSPRFLRAVGWTVFIGSILAISVATGRVAGLSAALWIAFCIPFAFLLLLQLSFWGYHAIRHGDAFYEPNDRHDVRIIYRGEEAKKRVKKMCPVCKRPTRCRHSPPGATIPFHIIRD